MTTHEEAMRQGARKILADYEHPPEGGTLVPRGWVEENRSELEVWAEVERQMLGDVSNWKPTGALPPGGEVFVICRSDLMHCLQVAVWRAGLLDQGTLARLKVALGIGEDESVPKPGTC